MYLKWMLQSGFQIVNLVIIVAFLGLCAYVLILLIGFLKSGTKAFQKYIDSDDDLVE